jgi:hypothetical protein
MTTSLTKVGSQVHQYFTRVNQVLAFERMMRDVLTMTAAMSPFPVDTNLTNYWASMFMPQVARPVSPWAFPAPQPKPVTGMDFFASAFSQAMPAAKPATAPASGVPMAFFANPFQPQQPTPAPASSVWPDYSRLMIVPMAMMMAAPSIDQMLGRAN